MQLCHLENYDLFTVTNGKKWSVFPRGHGDELCVSLGTSIWRNVAGEVIFFFLKLAGGLRAARVRPGGQRHLQPQFELLCFSCRDISVP